MIKCEYKFPKTSEHVDSTHALYAALSSPYFSSCFLSPRFAALVISFTMKSKPSEDGTSVIGRVNMAGKPATYNPTQNMISPR